jgi:hypothetical protein
MAERTVAEVLDGELVDQRTGEVLPVPTQRVLRGEVLARDQVQVTTADALTLANELRDVVNDRGWFSKIQGRDYLNVEAWTFIGGRLGLTAKTTATPFMHPTTNEWIGYNGHASLFDRRTGEVVAEADHVCLFKEPGREWAVNHAVGMSQTRAVSRAYQEQFRWIAQLAGYEGTPEEEMHGVGAAVPPKQRETPARVAKGAPPAREEGAANPAAQAFLFQPGDPQPAPPKFRGWLSDTVARTGKWAEHTWEEVCAGDYDSGRYRYCRWLLEAGTNASASQRERAAVAVWLMEQKHFHKQADLDAAKGQNEEPF